MKTVNSLNNPLGRKNAPRARFMAVFDLATIGGKGHWSLALGSHKFVLLARSTVACASDHDMYQALSARAFNPEAPTEQVTSVLSLFRTFDPRPVALDVMLRPSLHAGFVNIDVKTAPPLSTI